VESEVKTNGSYPKMAPQTHSVVAFFCGCGGLSLGFRGDFKYQRIAFPRLPFDFLAAYDSDPKCVETYRKNVSEKASCLDLTSFSPAEVPSADVLIGGFPCQDFSTCGPRRGLSSDRGRLYLAMVQYAADHKPKVILGENVPGLANLGNGEVLETIVCDLTEQGYRVKVWKLFAPDYGVPQNRSRLFIVGVRNDLDGFPQRPIESHTSQHQSIKSAIDDLKGIEDESVPNQSQYFKASKAKRGNGQGDETSRPDLPAYTVRANAKSRVQFHYSLHRRLTIRECARLQTFPDDFYFPHSATSNLMQIGNAVPPMLGHAVASSISEWLMET